MTRYWLFPLRVMPFEGPTTYMGPSGASGPLRTIVAPSSAGAKRIAPPADPIRPAAHRIEPESAPPLVLVTVSSTNSPVGTDALGLDGALVFGLTGSSAQAPSAATAATANASGQRPARVA